MKADLKTKPCMDTAPSSVRPRRGIRVGSTRIHVFWFPFDPGFAAEAMILVSFLVSCCLTKEPMRFAAIFRDCSMPVPKNAGLVAALMRPNHSPISLAVRASAAAADDPWDSPPSWRGAFGCPAAPVGKCTGLLLSFLFLFSSPVSYQIQTRLSTLFYQIWENFFHIFLFTTCCAPFRRSPACAARGSPGRHPARRRRKNGRIPDAAQSRAHENSCWRCGPAAVQNPW